MLSLLSQRRAGAMMSHIEMSLDAFSNTLAAEASKEIVDHDATLPQTAVAERDVETGHWS